MGNLRVTMTGILPFVLAVVTVLHSVGRAQAQMVKVVTVLERPYLFMKTDTEWRVNLGSDKYDGFVKDILDKVSDLTGLTFRLSVRKDGMYGMLHNGTWNGMLGELINRETDIAAGPLTVTTQRSRLVDFSKPFQTFGRVAIAKKFPIDSDDDNDGPSFGEKAFRLFYPFEYSVWLVSCLAWFVSSLVLYIIGRINPYEWRRMTKDREATLREGESFTCGNTYWFMIAAVFWQGFSRSPRSVGGRIVVAFWWLYAFIFVSMYIAGMTSYLGSRPQPTVGDEHNADVKYMKKIRSISDLSDDQRITFGALRSGATAAFLKNSRRHVFKNIWSRITKSNTFESSLKEGVERVRQSTPDKPYVFLAESGMADYHVGQLPCDLYLVRDYFEIGSYSFAYRMNYRWANSIDNALLQMREDGVTMELHKKWFHSNKCPVDSPDAFSQFSKDSNQGVFQKVGIASFSGAIILLAVGLLVGCLATLVEVFVSKYHKKDNNEEGNDDLECTKVTRNDLDKVMAD